MANETEVEDIEAIDADGIRADLWCPDFESHFICLLEEEVKKGNKKTSTLTKDSWRHVHQEMKDKTGIQYTQEQFKNKYNQLRKRWRNFGVLLQEPGIDYNSSTGRINASENKWKDLILKFHFSKSFKKKGCRHYDKLCTVFRDETPTGGAGSLTVIESLENSESCGEEEEEDGEDQSCARPKKRMNTCGLDRNDKCTSEGKAVAGAVDRIDKCLSEREAVAVAGELGRNERNGEMLKHKKAYSSTSAAALVLGDGANGFTEKERIENEQLTKAVEALQNLKGIHGSSFAKALIRLTENPKFALVFTQLTEERRKDVVLHM